MFRPLRAILRPDIQLVIISVFEGLCEYNGSVDYMDVICRRRFFNLCLLMVKYSCYRLCGGYAHYSHLVTPTTVSSLTNRLERCVTPSG
jgi:hypothetical protein